MIYLKRSGLCRAAAVVVAMMVSFFGTTGELRAVAVDSEILLLVDVSKSVTDSELAVIMDGFAQVFESAAVINSIQSGATGKIAASVVFFSDKNQQAVGLGWMEISDAASAQLFADELRAATRTSNKKKAGIATAIDFAVPLFGLETGGVANGFESTNQMMTFAANSEDNSSPAAPGLTREETVAAASQNALTAGVDMINAITLEGGASLMTYYNDYVVGGSVNGLVGTATQSPTFGTFEVVAQGVLGGEIAAASVPEPGVVFLGAIGLLILLRRRR